MSCKDCDYARQVGNKSRQDVIGCAAAMSGRITVNKIKADEVYEGYFYPQRRVGDTSDREGIGGGALVLGVITPATASCSLERPLS